MKNSPSCVSVLHKTLNLFHITVLQRTAKPGNVPKLKMHVQRDCFCSLRLLFCGVVIAAAAIMFSWGPQWTDVSTNWTEVIIRVQPLSRYSAQQWGWNYWSLNALEPTLGNKCSPIRQYISGMIFLITWKTSVHFLLSKNYSIIYCQNNVLRIDSWVNRLSHDWVT